MMTVQLFLFSLGGSAPNANIEVHDFQFVATTQLEQAFPILRERWFGDKQKIHLDGYTCITWADGYDVTLSTTPSTQEEKLFFVYVGAYLPHTLSELHDYGLFVAKSSEEAKQKALQTLLINGEQQHKDTLKDVDTCLAISVLPRQGSDTPYYVHLSANPAGKPNLPLWQGYRPI